MFDEYDLHHSPHAVELVLSYTDEQDTVLRKLAQYKCADKDLDSRLAANVLGAMENCKKVLDVLDWRTITAVTARVLYSRDFSSNGNETGREDRKWMNVTVRRCRGASG